MGRLSNSRFMPEPTKWAFRTVSCTLPVNVPPRLVRLRPVEYAAPPDASRQRPGLFPSATSDSDDRDTPTQPRPRSELRQGAPVDGAVSALGGRELPAEHRVQPLSAAAGIPEGPRCRG